MAKKNDILTEFNTRRAIDIEKNEIARINAEHSAAKMAKLQEVFDRQMGNQIDLDAMDNGELFRLSQELEDQQILCENESAELAASELSLKAFENQDLWMKQRNRRQNFKQFVSGAGQVLTSVGKKALSQQTGVNETALDVGCGAINLALQPGVGKRVKTAMKTQSQILQHSKDSDVYLYPKGIRVSAEEARVLREAAENGDETAIELTGIMPFPKRSTEEQTAYNEKFARLNDIITNIEGTTESTKRLKQSLAVSDFIEENGRSKESADLLDKLITESSDMSFETQFERDTDAKNSKNLEKATRKFVSDTAGSLASGAVSGVSSNPLADFAIGKSTELVVSNAVNRGLEASAKALRNHTNKEKNKFTDIGTAKKIADNKNGDAELDADYYEPPAVDFSAEDTNQDAFTDATFDNDCSGANGASEIEENAATSDNVDCTQPSESDFHEVGEEISVLEAKDELDRTPVVHESSGIEMESVLETEVDVADTEATSLESDTTDGKESTNDETEAEFDTSTSETITDDATDSDD